MRNIQILALLLAFSFVVPSTVWSEDSLLLSDFLDGLGPIPQGIVISEVNKSDKLMNIVGNAADNRSISKLKDALKTSIRVTRVDLLSTKLETNGKRTFRFKVYIARTRAPRRTLAVEKTNKRNSSKPERLIAVIEQAPIPDEIFIAKMSETNKSVRITGTAPDNQTIAAFIEELEKLDNVNRVNLDYSQTLPEGEKKFKLTVRNNIKRPSKRSRNKSVKTKAVREVKFTDKQKQRLDQLQDVVKNTGSRLAAALFSLEKQKFLSKTTNNTNSTRLRDPYRSLSSARLSSFSLKSALSSGLETLGTPARRFTDVFGLLTGNRAIEETLQMGTIGTGARKNSANKQILLTDVEALQIKTHPWAEMLAKEKKPLISEIFDLVPQDHFVVYFKHPQKFSQLEASLKEVASVGNELFLTSSLLELRKSMSVRLEIDKYEQLEPLIEEAAFVSEDLSFFPKTHYGLILKFKGQLLGTLSNYFPENNSFHETVGDYFVVTTSKKLLTRIKANFSNTLTSMRKAKDFQYIMTALDENRNGMLFMSETFIRKMVSPGYRVLAARRNKAIDDIEALQYAVIAYRVITSKWPSSFKQMTQDGYIKAQSVDTTFRVDKRGIVSHEDWGSLYNIRALSEVPITYVSKQEKATYDNFRNRYQRFWRRFFDPIGAAVRIDNNIYLHTVILPLIDQSEYNILKTATGGARQGFEALKSSLRAPPVVLYSALNFDELLLSNSLGITRRASNNNKPTREQQMSNINQSIQRELSLEESMDVFGIIGNELTVGVGTDIPFSLMGLSDLDLYVGIKIKDRERFDILLEKAKEKMFREFLHGNRQAMQLPAKEALMKTYRNHNYQIIPLGIANLYYFYHGNFVYFTIGSGAMSHLIDGIETKEKLSTSQRQAVELLSDKQNILLLADIAGYSIFRNNLLSLMPGRFRRNGALRNLHGYLTDINTFAKAIGGNKEILHRFFPTIPDSYHGVAISMKKGGVFLGARAKHRLEDVNFDSSRRHSRRNNKQEQSNPTVEFHKLGQDEWMKQFAVHLAKIKSFSLGLSFTEHGLDSKILVNNPLQESP